MSHDPTEEQLERELKFKLVDWQVAEAIMADSSLQLVSHSSWQTQHLVSRYYDTPDFQLSARGIALRLRTAQTESWLCIKQRGSAQAGLHIRYEDDYHLGTKTVGYRRYHAVFSYKQTN